MKSFLTLLLTVSIAVVLSAQTTETPSKTPPSNEPPKTIPYEVTPARRAVKPTKTTEVQPQPANNSEIKKQQDQQKIQEQLDKRQSPADQAPAPATAPQKKEAPVAPKEGAPKE